MTIKVTQELIDKHGRDVNEGSRCPIYYAMVALGFDGQLVGYKGVRLADDRWIPFPEEADRWQRTGVHRKLIEGKDPRDVLDPIEFEIPV